METWRKCQQDLHLAPARIITKHVESAWDFQSVSKSIVPLTTRDQLPSKAFQQGIGVLPSDAEKTYTLHWQSDLLPYKNDFNVYVWQPHLEQIPSACYNSVTIFVPPKDHKSQTTASSTDPARRLLVVANPPYLMPRFLRTQDALVRSGTQTQHVWDADHEKLRVIAIFFKWVVEDSSKLVDDMMLNLSEMVIVFRSAATNNIP